MFFVLSGFLITDILLKTVNTPGYFKKFYAKRILRIFPLYYLSLVILLLLLPRLHGFPLDFSYYIHHQGWFWSYLQNWLFIFHDNGIQTTALQHFWSLAVEEQFYLCWPLLIFFVRKPRWLILVTGFLLLLVISTRLTLWLIYLKGFNYFGLYTFTRIDGLCIGSMLAVIQFSRSDFLKKYFTHIVFFLAGMNFLFFFFNRQHQFSLPYLAIVGYTTFAILFALLIYESVENKNRWITRILCFSLFRFFGKISYGLYIIHWPVYLIFSASAGQWIKNSWHLEDQTLQFVTSLLLTIFSIALSILSFYGFERYFLNMKKYVS